MASSCGIHIDRGRFHLIALEGSPKKHKVVHHVSGRIPPTMDPATAVADGLRTALRKKNLPKDRVGLAVDSGLAAFRNLTLPFDDRGKIEEVLKYEIESDLPQWDIDDVVVDFLVTDSKPGVESHLIITALPKERLELPLSMCERAGLEATEAELDGSALFNAAYESGALTEDGAQILVHVGDTSTTVVVADGRRLYSMRAIRAGAMPVEALEAEVEGDDEDAQQAEPEEQAPTVEDTAARGQRQADTVNRIRRELMRTVSASRTQNPIDAILFCGHELEGLADDEALEVPTGRLEAVPQADEIPDAQEMVIAYGAALRQLGGGLLKARLRREELRFTGRFERIELPLAVAALLLLFLLLVQWVVLSFQIDWRDEGNLAADAPGDMQMWLTASNNFMLPNAESGTPGRLQNPPASIQDFARAAERGQIPDRTKFEQLTRINQLLQIEITTLQRELGQVSEVVQPQSALEASALVLGTLDALGEQVGRYAVRNLQSDYVPSRGGAGDSVLVKLDMDFHATDDVVATRHFRSFVNAVREAPWCVEFEPKSSKVLDGGEGIYVDGLTIKINTSLVPADTGGEA